MADLTDRTTDRTNGTDVTDLTPEAWETKYQEGGDRWDLGCPAPPFINLLAATPTLKPGRIAVLGCGTGQDAMLFAEAGFDVVGFDFAASAIERATAAAQARELHNIQFLQRNIFELESEFYNSFDYVLEHTCFCAIDPSYRLDYVQVVERLLRPNGQLIALFYTHDRPDGPPFAVTPADVLRYFELDFEMVTFGPALDSIERRKGEEHLGIFRVRKR
jgi:methyl halide transferase